MRELSPYLWSLMIVSATAAAYADAAPPELDTSIPSYQQSLDAFQAERAASGGPKLTAEEREVMKRAAEDLAAAMPDPGLPVGAQAPEFNLPNAFGESVALGALLEQGPVVVTFYRGAWCPYCNLQLRGLKDTIPYIEAEGAQLVAITPQKPDKSRTQVEKDGYPFEILSDLEDTTMRDYGLLFEVPANLDQVYRDGLGLNLAEYNGEGRLVLPVPATFVIDQQGLIVAAFADTDYRKRVEPAAIVAALKDISPTPKQ